MGQTSSKKLINQSISGNIISPQESSSLRYRDLYETTRLMCDNVGDYIWAKDLDRNYTFTNRELCQSILLTDDVDEPVGKTLSFFSNRIKKENPDDDQWYTIGDMSDHSDDFIFQFQKPIQVIISGYVRGEFIEVELHKAPFFDENNKFIGLVGSGRDVTKRKQIERELMFNEERLQLAIDGADLGVWDWHIDKGKLYVDPKWVGRFGFTLEDFNYDFSFYWKQIYPDDVAMYEEKLKSHFNNEVPSFEYTFRLGTKADNDIRWIKATGTVVERDLYEKPKRMVGIHQDVTKSIMQEQMLEEAMIRAKESDRLKTAFLANLSHEIRTPLNSILGFTRFLVSEECLSEKCKNEYLSIIEASSDSFLQTINNIIDIAKIESGVYELNKKDFDLRELCLDSISRIRSQFKYNENIKLAFSPEPEDDELIIFSDKNILDQIIYSLLSNAIKFTTEGEVEVGYELVDKEQLFIYVKDSGIGIDLEDKNVIYQPFRQLGESYNRKHGGAGLGLAIAYSMTEILSGKLWFESERERGTIFYVYIPLVQTS